MKIHTCLQSSPEWLQCRMGRVTASEMGNLLSPTFEIRKGEMPQTYLCKKVAEAWRGQPLPGFSGSWETEQGQLNEDAARSWYAFTFDQEHVYNVGFCEHDDGLCGCSPDALIDDDGGLELKAPNADTHVKYLLKGVVPPEYIAQVHASLYVTGRPWWRFVSYKRGFPAFVLKVERDEKICAQIKEAVAQFTERFNAAMAKLKEVNEK